jgi:hypothetical protein
MQNRLQNRPGVKSELFQELEDQCYPVLRLKDEIQTFTIVRGAKVDLTLKQKIDAIKEILSIWLQMLLIYVYYKFK